MGTGIIDIGYNAIRAVVYPDSSLGSVEVFKYRVKADISYIVVDDNLNTKHHIYLTLEHILHIFKKLNVTSVKAVATSALRGHHNADGFVNYVKQRFDLDIEIISGDREAYLTALGVISGIQHADGIVADLGGGSLELAEVYRKKVGKTKSLELGTKAMLKKGINKIATLTSIIKDEYGQAQYNNIYLVGGALRIIGRALVDFMRRPIKNLHNLEISVHEMLYFLEKIREIPDIASGRRPLDGGAVLIIRSMIELFQPKILTVSMYGLQEGVRFEMLSTHEQHEDIVLEKTRRIFNYNQNMVDWDNYLDILKPILISQECGTNYWAQYEVKTIFKLSVMMSSIAKNFDLTISSNSLIGLIMTCNIPLTHRMRIMLIMIVSNAFNIKIGKSLMDRFKELMTQEDYNTSQIIGSFMYIAYLIDGPEFTFPSFSIELDNKYLKINTKNVLPKGIFEKICETLKLIALARKARG